MNTLRIGWRNLLRNKRRTAVTVAALTLNTAILITSFGLTEGMLRQSINNATGMVVGRVQIHAPDYRAERSMYKDLPNWQELVQTARDQGLQAVARSYGYGLVSQGTKSAGASFWGIDPAGEREAFSLASRIQSGEFLPDQAMEAGETPAVVVIGRKLARSLQAKVGSELVAVVQAADGSMGNEIFVVGGILSAAGEEIDRGAVLLHSQDFERLFASDGRVHEVAINAPAGTGGNAEDDIRVENQIAGLYDALEAKEVLVAETWREILPAFADMLNLTDASMLVFAMVFVLAAGLGVLNTMLMATHDRVREYGVIKALGAGPGRIVRDVLAEAVVLSFVSCAIGTVLAFFGHLYLSKYGIDLSKMGGDTLSFSGVTFDAVWRTVMTVEAVVRTVIIMTVACVLASLYPAIKAARLDPVTAMTQV